MRRGSGLPSTLNQKSAIRLLVQHGWRVEQGGKHVVKMVKPGERPITLPHHGGHDYSPGLRSSILRQAGLVPNRDARHADTDGTPDAVGGE